MGARPSVTESGDGSRARGARHRFRGVAESPCGGVAAGSGSRRSVASPGVFPLMGVTAMRLPAASRRNCGASSATSSGTPVPRHGSQRDLTSVDSDRMMVNLGGVRCINEICDCNPATGHRGGENAAAVADGTRTQRGDLMENYASSLQVPFQYNTTHDPNTYAPACGSLSRRRNASHACLLPVHAPVPPHEVPRCHPTAPYQQYPPPPPPTERHMRRLSARFAIEVHPTQ